MNLESLFQIDSGSHFLYADVLASKKWEEIRKKERERRKEGGYKKEVKNKERKEGLKKGRREREKILSYHVLNMYK